MEFNKRGIENLGFLLGFLGALGLGLWLYTHINIFSSLGFFLLIAGIVLYKEANYEGVQKFMTWFTDSCSSTIKLILKKLKKEETLKA